MSVGVILISAPLQFSEILHCKYNRPICIIPQNERRIRYLFQKVRLCFSEISSMELLMYQLKLYI
jgi:hypothetical protein